MDRRARRFQGVFSCRIAPPIPRSSSPNNKSAALSRTDRVSGDTLLIRLDEAELARIVARAHDLGRRERLAYIRAACANDPGACDRGLAGRKRARRTARGRGEHDEPYWELGG